jgi:hypothetical protein
MSDRKDKTSVVSCKLHTDEVLLAMEAIYVGRAMPRVGRPFVAHASPLANPYVEGRDGNLEDVLAKYEDHVLSRPDLMALLPWLRGRVLACWCLDDPDPVATLAKGRGLKCHAQLLADLAERYP